MKQNPDGKTVAAMDMLVPGIGEIIGGSERENDYDKLLTRMKELGLKEEDYSFYLDLRKYGCNTSCRFWPRFREMRDVPDRYGQYQRRYPIPTYSQQLRIVIFSSLKQEKCCGRNVE